MKEWTAALMTQKLTHSSFMLFFWSWYAIMNYKRVEGGLISFPSGTLVWHLDIKMNKSLKNKVK
jgi:hypothetical protein